MAAKRAKPQRAEPEKAGATLAVDRIASALPSGSEPVSWSSRPTSVDLP